MNTSGECDDNDDIGDKYMVEGAAGGSTFQ